MLLTLARVLWLIWRDTRNPEAGGAETYIQELSNRLVRQGFEITQFCAAFPGSSVFEVLDGVRIIRRGAQKTVYVKAAEYFLRNRGEFDLVVDSINTIPFFAPLYTQGTRVVP